MSTYGERLRDPRWQQKRLRVMERAGWKCEKCGDKTTTLNVHHERYVSGRMPWEYDDSELHCLCEPCHSREHGLPIVEAQAPRRQPTAEEAPIYKRLNEIDAAFTGATNEEKDALIYEKIELANKLRALRPPRWKGM